MFSQRAFRCGTLKDKLAFDSHSVPKYLVWQYSGDSLSKYFANGVNKLIPGDRNVANSDTRWTLSDFLRIRNVFVPKKRNIFIPDALYCVAKGDFSWPSDNSEKGFQQTLQTILFS